MKIGVYLTCQGLFFERLAQSGDFGIEVYQHANFVLFDKKASFPDEWKNVDAFLYQPIINPPSDYYRDENLLENFVAKNAIRIRLPYIMYTGIFPWYRGGSFSPELKTAYSNSWIEDDIAAFASGAKTSDSILYREDTDTRGWHEKSIGLLRQKEAESDISGLSDFIEENLKTSSLFWTPNHPRGQLAHMFCSKAFNLLGLPAIPESYIAHLDDVLTTERTPVLPCVRRELGIKRADDIAFFDGSRIPMTSSQYIDRYIKVRKGMPY